MGQQFFDVRFDVKKSKVMQYGNMKFTEESVSNFEGETKHVKKPAKSSETYHLPISRYATYLIAKKKLREATNNSEEQTELLEKLSEMKEVNRNV
jgi:hypothetical protein